MIIRLLASAASTEGTSASRKLGRGGGAALVYRMAARGLAQPETQGQGSVGVIYVNEM